MHIKKSTIYEGFTTFLFIILLVVCTNSGFQNLIENHWWVAATLGPLGMLFLTSLKNWMIELFEELSNRNTEA